MNVLCDLSLFAHCGDDPAKITGMPRTLLELGARLPRVPGADVTFCAAEWPERALPVIRQQPAFRNARVALATPSDDGRVGHLGAAVWEEAQVFHSTHGAIPDAARGFPHLGVVQTVWDMIPFVLPEMFTAEDLGYYRNVLAQLRPADTVITISRSAKTDFCAHTGHDPAGVHVTPLAADPEQFRPCRDAETLRRVREHYRLPPDAPYLLSLCTFEPRKNLRHVIRAFAALVETQPGLGDLQLVLAGGTGWKFDGIFAELNAAHAVRDRIIITGFVADSDLAPLLSGALAFLYLSTYEGFGLPPLEAMQCGAPVVVSNVSSLPEVVGDAGIRLAPDDQDGLCQAMLDLYRRPELRADLATRSIARARLFSWDRCARETVAAYRAACG